MSTEMYQLTKQEMATLRQVLSSVHTPSDWTLESALNAGALKQRIDSLQPVVIKDESKKDKKDKK